MKKLTPQQQLGRDRARGVVKSYGPAWGSIGSEFQRNALAREMVSIMLCSAPHNETAQMFAETWRAMCDATE